MNYKDEVISKIKPRIKISGSGVCLGSAKISDEDLDRTLNLPKNSIFKKTGVRFRYKQFDRNLPLLASRAARDALQDAGWRADELNAIISVSAVPYTPIPCNAIHIQKHLNLGHSGITCFDMNATCLGFFPAFDLCALKLSLGIWKKVLLISGDCTQHALNSENLETYGLFGDSATALCLERGHENQVVITSLLESYSDHLSLCQLAGGNLALPAQEIDATNAHQFYFNMQGHQLFKQTASMIKTFCNRVFDSISIDDKESYIYHLEMKTQHDIPKSFSDIDLIIPHQASPAAMTLIRKRLEIPKNKWIDIVEDYGNCVSGSVPMALHFARKQKKFTTNQNIFLLGTGAGLSLGGIILRN